MNKRGMIAQLVGAMVAILIGLMLIPTIMEQVNLASKNTGPSLSYYNVTSIFGDSSQNLMALLPVLIGAVIIIFGIALIYNAFKDAVLVGGKKKSGVKDEEEDEEDNEDDEEDNYEEDDEEDEEEEEDKKIKQKPKLSCRIKKENEEVKHETTITTINKDGTKKVNVKIGSGYHVDQYALDKSSEDSSLTITEDNFKKTKYD